MFVTKSQIEELKYRLNALESRLKYIENKDKAEQLLLEYRKYRSDLYRFNYSYGSSGLILYRGFPYGEDENISLEEFEGRILGPLRKEALDKCLAECTNKKEI